MKWKDLGMRSNIIILWFIFCFLIYNGIYNNDFSLPYGSSIKSSGFSSNGERIYFTAISDSGEPIIASTEQLILHDTMTCVACHGYDKKGGVGRMMATSFEAPDIRYSTLTVGHDEEQPYTDVLIKHAITNGIDSDGMPFERPMHKWQMSEADLHDLVEYIKI